jgi:hypothetical protein
VATANDCKDCRYVEWAADLWAHAVRPNPLPIESDRAVAARAVACLRLDKTTASAV